MKTGSLHLIQSNPDPNDTDGSRLFLFKGSSAIEPISEIVPLDNVTPPGKQNLVSANLKVLHINDLHGQFHRQTPSGEQPFFSRIVGRINELRSRYQEDPETAVLTVSAGDDVVGSIYSELLGVDADTFSLNAAYRLFSAAGVDVSVIGNHDLDLGSEVMACSIKKDARFPVLSANMTNCINLNDLCAPAALFVIKGIRIGVIGLTAVSTTRQLLHSKLVIADPITAVSNLLPSIQPLCDLVIILSHLGFRGDTRSPGDVELAQSLPHGSVSLIIGGHSHDILNKDGLEAENIINGIPIVQSGAFGEYLGEVDIKIQNNIASVTNARLLRTESLPIDHKFEEREIQPLIVYKREIESIILGEKEDNPLFGTEAVQQGFACCELALANFITDGMVTQLKDADYQVDFAMIDATSIVSGLTSNKILTLGEWFAVMPYADTIRLYKITGKQLFDLLQDNAVRIRHSEKKLLECGFLQFSKQVRYAIELGKNRIEHRARDILVNSVPLNEQMDTIFTAAAPIFARGLSGNWNTEFEKQTGISLMDLEGLPHIKTDIFLRNTLVLHIQNQKGISQKSGARLDGRISFIDGKPDEKSATIDFNEGRKS